MSFLPIDYKAPAGSNNYMKFQEGENRFRVLSEAVVGWEGWKDNVPFRRKGTEQNINADEVDVDAKYGKGKPKINHFWGFLVYDYDDKCIKILTLTQKTIMKGIQALVDDKDWGDPMNYDISVAKIKKGERTTYSIKSYPPKAITPEIVTAMTENKLNLEDIFKGKSDDDMNYN